MAAIFLSASVPVEGRGDYYKTADPFLIQMAVRELVMATIPHWQIVWGGHPAITPMIEFMCQELDVSYESHFILYQSLFFQDMFPEENRSFESNIVLVDKVDDDREASLRELRKAMLSREDLEAAVFIGGMDGVEVEYSLFHQYHPQKIVLPVVATGGAAQKLWERIHHEERDNHISFNDLDFAKLFRDSLSIDH